MDTVRILEIKNRLENLDIMLSETITGGAEEQYLFDQLDDLEHELDFLTEQLR
jgi:hypothetical protein